ncbi:hypothetical protein EDD37DRAFT_194510 [Exophiala viscosa]|uniref:uncharacterized protein n=1 Tax=Exophiala viscosa TaxID=2486360 RepID=UPI00218F099B|nr:hypothetical protein EDD37DRAFT_194510 [Exophiala viscosa]
MLMHLAATQTPSAPVYRHGRDPRDGLRCQRTIHPTSRTWNKTPRLVHILITSLSIVCVLAPGTIPWWNNLHSFAFTRQQRRLGHDLISLLVFGCSLPGSRDIEFEVGYFPNSPSSSYIASLKPVSGESLYNTLDQSDSVFHGGPSAMRTSRAAVWGLFFFGNHNCNGDQPFYSTLCRDVLARLC